MLSLSWEIDKLFQENIPWKDEQEAKWNENVSSY